MTSEPRDPWLPGSVGLIEDVDKKLLVVLRDGRTLIGYLRTVDQFANLVLHQTIERIYVGQRYGDIPRGIFLIRGENVVLIGEIDLEKERELTLEQVNIDEILDAQRKDLETKQKLEEVRQKALKVRGMIAHHVDIDDIYS